MTLGHRRLSIIDLSAEAGQPIANETDQIQVAFNGEIYNHRSLRSQLSHAGHRFRSATDSEVLVHGFEEWGIAGLLQRLCGMFAFALYDETASPGRLFLARDRIGIKPLYYSVQPEEILFASEVRPLLRSARVRTSPDPLALQRFLQMGSIAEPDTWIGGIKTLPAGYFARVDRNGLTLHRYYNLEHRRAAGQFEEREEVVPHLRELLGQIVQEHLLSDVPLGVFLSGGIDSSSLASLAKRSVPDRLTTVSVVFEEEEFSEAVHARAMAEKLDSHHREIVVGEKEFAEALPTFLSALDQPSIDGFNTYFVADAARQAGLTVVLSGLGGDEVFLGYRHFRAAFRWGAPWRWFSRLPRPARTLVLSPLAQLGKAGAMPSLAKLDYLMANHHSEGLYLLYRALFTPREIRRLLGLSAQESAWLTRLPTPLNGALEWAPVDQLIVHEFNHYLRNQLLRDTDVMSMQHSLEVRVPFLDHRLIEFLGSVPAALKFDRVANKPLLIEAVGDLPEQIWNRPKMGFSFPMARWLREIGPELEEQVISADLFDRAAVAGLWSAFQSGRCHWSKPWATLVAASFSQRGVTG